MAHRLAAAPAAAAAAAVFLNQLLSMKVAKRPPGVRALIESYGARSRRILHRLSTGVSDGTVARAGTPSTPSITHICPGAHAGSVAPGCTSLHSVISGRTDVWRRHASEKKIIACIDPLSPPLSLSFDDPFASVHAHTTNATAIMLPISVSVLRFGIYIRTCSKSDV